LVIGVYFWHGGRMRIQIATIFCFFSACGSTGGTLTGKVAVEGGSAANIPVIVLGPQSAAAVTNAEGVFSAANLPDGNYVVRATVRGAEVEEQSAPAVLKGGKVEAEPTLAFKFPNGKLTGKVVFSDASDAANLTVALSGTASKATKTTSGGAFSFEGLHAGTYVVSVEAANTKEGRASVGVAVAGAMNDAGELKLTPIGSISGTVNFMGTGVVDAQVSIPGTSFSATTDAMGKFSISNVPTGTVILSARQGLAPFSRSAGGAATVMRGAAADVTIDLMADPPKLGTVKGSVTFFGPQDPTVITVSVPGTMYTAKPAINGAFSISVPEGQWDVVATAKHHPKQVLAKLSVRGGEIIFLPSAVLSWFETIGEFSGNISFNSVRAFKNWYAVSMFEGSFNKLILVNSQTKEIRTLTNQPVPVVQFSSNAKYVGFTIGATLMTYEIATGEMVPRGNSISQFSFSTDETVLFVSRLNALERTVLSTNVTTRFPTTGSASSIVLHTNERWTLFESTGGTTKLITPTTDAQVFSNVSVESLTSSIWALTDCSVMAMVNSCKLRIVPNTSTTASIEMLLRPVVQSGFSQLSAAGDYAAFQDSNGTVLVNMTSAVGLALPSNTVDVRFNADGTRYAFLANTSPTVKTAYEGQTSSTVVPASVGSGTLVATPTYVALTRAVAFDFAMPRRVIDIKMGTATIETDVSNTGTLVASGSTVTWVQNSTSKVKYFLGDGPTGTVNDVSALNLITSFASGYDVKCGPLVSTVQTTAWIANNMNTNLKRIAGIGTSQSSFHVGTIDYTLVTRALPFSSFGPQSAYDCTNDILVETAEGSSSLLTPNGDEAVGFSAPNNGRILRMGVMK
jgi:uncharacterized protein YaiE (UPF0345 family)